MAVLGRSVPFDAQEASEKSPATPHAVQPALLTSGDEEAQMPLAGHEPLQRWNGSKTNTFRFLSALFTFIIIGMNDGAVGVSLSVRPSLHSR